MRKLFLLLIVTMTMAALAAQQIPDIKKYIKTDISKVPDNQIRQFSNELQKRGITFNQAKLMLKSEGMSDKQINELEKRLLNINNNVKSKQNVNNQSQNQTTKETYLTSQKNMFVATKQDSLIFGFSLFNNEKLTFEPSLNIPVTDDYILGAGDEILIDIWGLSSQSYDLIVSSTGSIEIPIVGPVFVSGQTLRDARKNIESRLKTIYSDLGNRTSASIKIGQLRTINVNVLGEVFAPGTYTVSGASSLFNVLYLSGGPNHNGSFRNIQLIRNGRIVSTLDVYDFLLNGKASVNVPIYDNDIIMIPTYQKRIYVSGDFKRNGYFEAKEGESVANMIKYAGGVTPAAQINSIELYSIGSHGRELKTITLENASSILLANGDSLSIKTINTERIDNILTIEGAVFSPGNYEYKSGIKLSQLIQMAGGLTENVFKNRGVITRLKDDYTLESLNFNVENVINGTYDVQLKSGDNILIASIDDIRTEPSVTLKGYVKNPSVFEYRENLTLGDLILLAGGLIEKSSIQNVEIVRQLSYEEADTSLSIIANGNYVTITRDLNIENEGNSYILQPFDIVTVRSIPTANFSGTVTITGEVRFSGTYELMNKNDNITSLIKRAGGFTENAFIEGARLYRRVSLSEKEKLIKQNQLISNNDTSTIDIDNYLSTNSYELVSIDLKDFISNESNSKSLQLLDGDEIVVPKKMQTVRVSGQILNPSSTIYIGKKSAKKYIMNSGGFASRAKKNKTFVIHANGQAEATSHFLFFRHYPRVQPGSEIVVPEKPERQGASVAQLVSITSSLVTIAVLLISVL